MSCVSEIQKIGADPANIQWSVVRGDTASIQFQFLEDDEVTPINTTGWSAAATAYNPINSETYELDVEINGHIININASTEDTEEWGTGAGSVVAELSFDLEITKPDSTVWTPIIGTICVLGDITGGSL